MVNRKLGRTSAHRNALFRNQLSSLIDRERIITTLPKAKELRPQVERLVTIGKTDNVHNRRQVFRVVADETLVAKVFDTLGPRFADRPGGYTRIIKIGPRRGDAAETAIIEFVGYEPKLEEKPAETSAKAKKAAPKKEAPEPEAEETEAAEEETPKKKKAPARKAAPKKKAKKSEEKPKKKAAPKKKK
jgi:large subunit ribosomal protein L17